MTQLNQPSCFFISCFTVSATPSINTLESFNDFMILIILFTSSFEANKVNPFTTLTDPFTFAFLSDFYCI